MSKRLSGINPLSYMGVEPYVPPAMHQNGREPSANDSSGYNLGDFWLVIPPGYSGPEKLFVLISLNLGQATWVQLYPAGGGSSIQFETDAGTVNPALGIVNVVGDGVKINTTGTGNTITINSDSDVANEYVTDSGTAIPSSNELNVVGGSNITTLGAGNTVTVTLNPNVTILGNFATTGDSTLAQNVFISSIGEGVVQTNSSDRLFSDKGTNGQLLIGSTAGAPAWANLTSTGGTVTITNNANSINLETAGGGGGNTIISQFTSSGTWTKNVATQYVEVYGWCAGGGGASGSIPNAFGRGSGGGGGGSYGVFYFYGPAFCFDNSVAITVGAGGMGGAGTGLATPNPGGDGGPSFFGSISTRAANNGGPLNGSGGGNNSSLNSFGISTPGYWGDYTTSGLCINYLNSRVGASAENWPGTGGFSSVVGFDGSPGVSRGYVSKALNQPTISYNIDYGSFIMSGTGGGGAGLITTGTTAENGGAGGSIRSPVDGAAVLVAGGTAGDEDTTIDGGNGADGVTIGVVNLLCGGAGGGGGGNQSSGMVAGNGGNGGFPGGGGGGGGAAKTTTSGSGGNGADGLVIVIEYL